VAALAMPAATVVPEHGTALAFGGNVHFPMPALLLLYFVLAPSAALSRDGASALPASATLKASTLEPALALGWQPGLAGRRQLAAVALDRASGRVAVGDARGVVLLGPSGAVAGASSRPDVTALAFTARGALLVGTAQGLFLREENGDLLDRSPAPGDEARRIARLAACAGAIGAATAAGVYLSRDGHIWQPASGSLGRAEASAIALQCRPEVTELRAVAGGDVWRATLQPAENGLAVLRSAPIEGLDPGLRARAVDVLLEDDGTEIVLADGLLAIRSPGANDWSIVRPAVSPGAALLRVAAAAGRRWLATDRGLFAEDAAGAWLRLPPASALSAARDVAGDAVRVLAATEDGLLDGRLEARAEPEAVMRRAAVLALEFPGRREPAVQEIFRAALDYLALRPEAMRNLRRGLATRGLFPKLELHFQRGRSLETDLDYDESFVSGELRRLHDQHQGKQRDVAALLQLSWELGDVAFSPDAIDLSREARAVIQLRDDVLDEITHLFFERRRVLLELAALDPLQDVPASERLRLRADELAAGLDSWTGGWFGQRVPPLAP